MTGLKKFQILLVILLVGVGMFFSGYYLGKRGFVYEVKKNPPYITIDNKFPPDQNIDFQRFWDVWETVNSQHLNRPFDANTLVDGAISGMVDAVGDNYSTYLPAELYAPTLESIDGSYQGIGAELDIIDGELGVVAPLDGSPAEEAGLKAGDIIRYIDGESTAGISISEAVYKIRGTAGTVVTLTVKSGNSQERDIQIKRGVITVDSVTWDYKGDGNIYIRVSRFGNDTNSNWDNVVKEINSTAPEIDTIIIDLRSNPGGYVTAAIHIAEEFYNKEPVFYQESATGKQVSFDADRIGSFESVPQVFVLIDGGSASASEIVAAALRDHASAILVGEKSFGKGTMQDSEEYSNGAGLFLTTAKWLTPSKEWVHEIGIEPDIVVEFDEEAYKNGVDNQLEKVLQFANPI